MTERSRSGKTAWDKEKTRELFRRYKDTGDPDAREQLVMSHMTVSYTHLTLPTICSV